VVVLPSPPSQAERGLYLRSGRWLYYGFGALSSGSLMIGMLLFSTQHLLTLGFLPVVVLTMAYLGLSYLVGFLGRDFDYNSHMRLILRPIDAGGWDRLPTVDVFLPCAGEPLEVLRNTYRAVLALNYPHDKIFVHVLDDSTDGAAEHLARVHGFAYIRRPDPGVLKKAGNLRHAFKITRGELILILDADFCPSVNFLVETVPHFQADPKLGILQTPQFFRVLPEQTWVERGASQVQELFYRLIQVSRDRFGGAVCVGTNAVYRRTALEPHGTAAIAYSEDLHTGIEVLERGWGVKYIPVNLACGISPDALPAFFNQQYRWCMGSFTLFLTKRFWTSPITGAQRLCYLTGMLYYMGTGVGAAVAGIPSLVMVWAFPERLHAWNFAFAIPSLLFGTLFMSAWSKSPWGFYTQRARIVQGYSHLFAMIDKLTGNLMPWQATGASSSRQRFEKFVGLFIAQHAVIWGLTIYGCWTLWPDSDPTIRAALLVQLVFTAYSMFLNGPILKEVT
jgi:cellulose synthase/poly-beta-1,6-N-acetylglucosamine synthase-like glycosyltransferase